MATDPVCANFFPDIVGDDTTCIDTLITGTGTCDDPLVIAAEPVISSVAGNSLQCLEDGLYASQETLCFRLNFGLAGEVCVSDPNCLSYEFIAADSVMELSDPYVAIAPQGSDLIIELVDTNGIVLSTGTIPTGSNTGSWSPSDLSFAGETYIATQVTQVGSSYPGCGLGQSALVCEPTSLFAPGSIDSTCVCCEDCPDASGCQCYVIAGNNVSVAGDGSQLTPYVITATVDETITNMVTTPTSLTYTNEAGVPQTFSIGRSLATCNALEIRSDGLYVEDNPYKLRTSFVDSSLVIDGATVSTGDIYHQIVGTVTNNDPCGRTMWLEVDYGWQGVVFTMINGASVIVEPQQFVGGSWVSPAQAYMYGTSGTRDYSEGTWNQRDGVTLAPGSSVTLGSRYWIRSASAGVTMANAASIFTNYIRVNGETV